MKASKKSRRQREGKKCCQSVLAEQGADGSRREDSWRAGAMHYSGIIQTERDHWGKTPQGPGKLARTWIPHTPAKNGVCILQQELLQQIKHQDCGGKVFTCIVVQNFSTTAISNFTGCLKYSCFIFNTLLYYQTESLNFNSALDLAFKTIWCFFFMELEQRLYQSTWKCKNTYKYILHYYSVCQ